MANSIQVVVKCQSGRVMVFGDTNVTASTTTTLKSQGVGLNQTDNIDLGNALVGETITHAFGTVTWWAGQFFGWTTRIRAGACTSCGGSGRFRPVYGNSSRSAKGAQRWPQCVATGANAIVAEGAD